LRKEEPYPNRKLHRANEGLGKGDERSSGKGNSERHRLDANKAGKIVVGEKSSGHAKK